MKKTLLLLLLLALPIGVLGLMLSGDPDESPRSRLGPQGVESTRAGSSPGRLESPTSSASETPAAQASAKSAGRAAARGSERAVDADTARLREQDARFVEVQLSLPAGAPQEEDIRLFSFSNPAGDSLPLHEITKRAGALDFLEDVLGVLGEETVWADTEVRWGGTTRVPFHRDASGVVLVLRSRYVWAPVTKWGLEEIANAQEDRVVECELGAWVTGRVLLPAGAAERGVGAQDVSLSIQGRDGKRGFFGGNSRSDSRELTFEEELDFELRALSASQKYALAANAPRLVPYGDFSHVVLPGAHEQLELPLTLGATISGTVVGDDGSAVAEASVSPGFGGFQAMLGAMVLQDSSMAETDAAGAWILDGVPAGKLRLTATAEDWLSGEPVELEVFENQVVEGIQIVLQAGSSISGVVRWQDGSPAEGAEVSTASYWHARRGGSFSGVVTDASGAFVVRPLEDGDHDLQVTATPAAPSARPGTPDAEDGSEVLWRAGQLGVPAGTTGLVLTLNEPFALRGIVVDEIGAAVTSFDVRGESPGTPEWSQGDGPGRAFLPADGRFELSGFYPGDWGVEVQADGYASSAEPVRVVIPQTGPELRIVLRRATSIRGIVTTPDGTPIAEADVTASEGIDSDFVMRFRSESRAPSREDGSFELEDCPPDGAYVWASHEDWAPSEKLLVTPLEGLTTEGVVIALRQGATVTGEVFDKEGLPKPGMLVTASVGGSFGFGGDENATTDAAGFFRLERIEPGKVTVTAIPGEETMLALAESAGTDEQAMMTTILGAMRTKSVEVQDGEVVHVILGTEPGEPVRIFGRVIANGEPVPGYSITAMEEGKAIFGGLSSGRSDEQGNYEVTVERPGAYLLVVGEEAFGDPRLTRVLDVPEGEEYRADLTIPSATVSGIVLTPEGAPAAGIGVSLFNYDILGLMDLANSNDVQTGSDGTFAFENVGDGHYEVGAGGVLGMMGQGDGRHGRVIRGGIEVRGDKSVTGIEIRLSRPGTLEGVVKDREGSPVPGATLYARDAQGRVLSPMSFVQSNAAGRFSMPGLGTGAVTLFARTGTAASYEVGPFEVTAQGSREVELVLEEGAYFEVVLLEDGEPTRGRLVVTDAEGRRQNGLLTPDAISTFATEGFSSLEQRVGPLPPGEYQLEATGRSGKSTRKSVTIRPGMETRKVKLRLK